MRSRRPSPEQQEAVSRRLALLSEQLAAGREPDPVGRVDPASGGEWWDDHTRVSAARAALHAVPDPPPADRPLTPAPATVPPPPAPPATVPSAVPAAVPVPVPGRHAARRRVPLGPVVPETLRGRVRVGAGALAVVALLVSVGLAVTAWQVLRDDPGPPVTVSDPPAGLVPVEAPGAQPSTAPPAAPPAPAEPLAGAAGAATVTVDVAGRVRRPGIVVLDAGARVVDALERAGGARPAVDLSSLNLARVLVDGEQILVGVDGGAPVPPSGSASGPAGATVPGSAGAPAGLVDLNLADQALLETLPDVGPVTAAAIIAWREEHGAFTAVTELLEVSGIGDATLATLTPLVTV
ncbi:ComEA family DNA-binding protein [Nocardioides dongxiaopingii]|uniref:ComEA family DNA-binding protein n=1 Tax=Nocardioides sp. S-1144 TaxID=2582905 RepID=UPI00110E6CA6|nr:ComEA family DNA-binding protein [Nocardioides sp. S-1144]QCW50594.1 ComEA family DNA-binding protein [Nocardioides sp. S-1144]